MLFMWPGGRWEAVRAGSSRQENSTESASLPTWQAGGTHLPTWQAVGHLFAYCFFTTHCVTMAGDAGYDSSDPAAGGSRLRLVRDENGVLTLERNTLEGSESRQGSRL